MHNSGARLEDCPVCHAAPEGAGHDWLFRCSTCGLLLSALQERIGQAGAGAVIDEDRRRAGLEQTRSRSASHILDVISGLIHKKRKRLLDVGCGSGVFLRHALARGFDAIGIDPDGHAVETARRLSIPDVRQASFPAGLGPGEIFDVIVFNDVLEHLRGLDAVLEACRDRLDEGGILAVTCPDQRGVFYRTAALLGRFGIRQPLRRLWQFGYPSPHAYYFAPRHLETICGRHGFSVVRCERMIPFTLSSLWNRISYAKDQGLAFNLAALGGVAIAFPFILALPRDEFTIYFVKER